MRRLFLLLSFSLLATPIGILGCGVYRELRSIDEYGALQSVEYDNRTIPIGEVKIVEIRGYRVAGFPAAEKEPGNVWVLLNPQYAPRFKQMPADTAFRVSATGLDAVRRTPGVPDDVLSELTQRVAR